MRIAEGLYRYRPTGRLYATCLKENRRVWRALPTRDRAEGKKQLAVLAGGQKTSPDDSRQATSLSGAERARTLGDLLDQYDQNLNGLAAGTAKVRRYLIGVFKRTWTGGVDTPLSQLTTGSLKTWLGSRKLRRVGQQNYVRVLRGLLSLAVDLKWLPDNPAQPLSAGKPEEPLRLTPSWEEALRIVSAVRRRASREALEFMLLAGLGQAELRNLRGEHFDFERGTIAVRRQKTQRCFRVPMFPHLRPMLDRLRAEGVIRPGKAVFTCCNPRAALRAATLRLSLPHYSPRSLRRCFITRAIERGVDFKTLAAWQGHRDGGLLIAKVYSYLRTEHSARMAGLLT